MFENQKNYARGNKAGYVTEGHSYPENSVQDCNNLEFMEGYDRRRPPYRQISQSGTTNIADIGAEFKRIGLYEKDYLDADGNIETVLVLVMKHAINFSIKIFVNKFYNPDSSYGNNNSDPVGWTEAWTEVTEGYYLTDSDYYWQFLSQNTTPLSNKYLIYGTSGMPEWIANKPLNYYKGWFVYDKEKVCIGQIMSIEDIGGTVYEITVGLNSIVNHANTNNDVLVPYADLSVYKFIDATQVGGTTEFETTTPHGYTSGDTVIINGLLGDPVIVAINGVPYVITVVNTVKFTIAVNTTGAAAVQQVGVVIKAGTDSDLGDVYIVRYPFAIKNGMSIMDGKTFEFPSYSITAITNAASGVITTDDIHAFNVGDQIYISDVVGMTEINGKNGTVTNAIGNMITVNIDTSTFTAYASGGTVRKYIPDMQFVDYASMTDSFNSIKICLGNKIRPIRLSFLQGKKFWNPNSSQHNVTWNGYWLKYDIPQISNIEKVIKYEGVGLGTGNSGQTEITNIYDNTHPDTDSQIESDLGIAIYLKSERDYLGSSITDDYNDVVVGTCITLDGYQTVFVKYFIGGKYVLGGTNYYTHKMQPAYIFFIDFDRSITDTNTFADSPSSTSSKSGGGSFQDINSFMLISDVGGITELSEATAFNYLFAVNIHLVYLTANQRNRLYPAYIKQNAIGIPLNSAINSKYYHSPVSAFNIIFKLGEDNMIGADIGEDFLGVDSKLKDKYGYSKIVLSNLQFRDIDGTAINTDSCFGEERIRQLITGEKIVAGESTIDNRFVLFTDRSAYSYRVIDETLGSIDTVFSKYLLIGTYSQRTVVRAKVGDQFAGIYWVAKGKDSIYRMLDNTPQDILEDRWRETFRSLNNTDKQNAIVGFNARTNDVHFVIGNKIFVWNLERENWQIYTFVDKPELYFTDSTGQIIFTSGLNIFRLEPYDTEQFKDETTAGEIAIPFKLVKSVDYGTEISEKIFDRINIEFDKVLDDAVTENPVRVKVGQDGAENNLLDETVSITSLNQFHRSNKLLRTPSAKHRVEINYSDSAGGIKKFELKELLILSKATARRLSP